MTAEDRITAAELAIGLLAGEEAAGVSARAAVDPAFAQEVAWWQQQLAPLLAQVGDVAPPPHLRDRIEARLDVPDISGRRRPARWHLLGIGGALGALAASFVAWVLPATTTSAPPPAVVTVAPRLLVASLLPAEGKQKAVVAVLNRDAATLRLSASIDVPGGRAAQFWRIPAGGSPVSLGVLPGGAAKVLALPGASAPSPGDQLAISVEPAGGSPTGQPTGAVILAGAVSSI